MYRQWFPDDPGQHVEGEYTRTTYRHNPSFCERVCASLLAVVVGLALLTAASGSEECQWTEGRAVQTTKSQLNQEALYLMNPLQTSEMASEQNNEMYQCQSTEQEHKKEVNEGERTRTETCSYDKYWRVEAMIRGPEFANPIGHHNPPEMPIKGMTSTAQSPAIGKLKLSERKSGRINNFHRLTVKDVSAGAQLHAGMVCHRKNPFDPQQMNGHEHGHEQAQNTFLSSALHFGGWLLMFIVFGCLNTLITGCFTWIIFTLAARVAVHQLAAQLKGLHIKDQHGVADVTVGKVEYGITNVVIESFRKPTSQVTVGAGLTWAASGAGIGIRGRWHYKYKLAFIGLPISDSGSLDVSGSGINFSVKMGLDKGGRPAMSYIGDIGDLDVKFHGGASWLYNIFNGMIAWKLKETLNDHLSDVYTI